MNDHLLIHRIALYAYHGVHPEEARLGQRFFVTLDAVLDLSPAGIRDDPQRAVSYADLVDIVQRIGTGSKYKLIETLAERIAAEILSSYHPIAQIRVRIDKPEAPIPGILDGVSVEILRNRDG